METKLNTLFEYQRFERNSHLQNLIEKTLNEYENRELSEDELALVNAAGVTENHTKPKGVFDND